MSNMPGMKAPDMIALLKEYFWEPVGQSGSHQQYGHPNLPGKITVERHAGKDLPHETVRSIMKQAGMEHFYRMLAKGAGLRNTERAIKREAREKFGAPSLPVPAIGISSPKPQPL